MLNTVRSREIESYVIRSLIAIVSVAFLVAFLLVVAISGKASNYGSCTLETCISPNNCTIPSCIAGKCVLTPLDGCCNDGVCNTTEPGIFKYQTLFVRNITGRDFEDSYNDPMYIEGVMFQNSTTIFDCLIDEPDCPNFYKNISFETAVYVNNLLQYNQSFVKINDIVQIRSTGLMEALQAYVNIENLNATGNICAPDFSACNTSIFMNGVTISNGTITIDVLHATGMIINQMTITVAQSFNVTEFILGNSTAQASNRTDYRNIIFNPSGDNVGIGFSNRSLVESTLDVNGTLAGPGFTFNIAEFQQNQLLSTFEYYVFNTTIWGPWATNRTWNFMIHQEGLLVTLEFPEEFNETATYNGTIGSTKPIPPRFRPNTNSDAYYETDIVVISDASYNGLPGVFRMNVGDGMFQIYATIPTNGTTTYETSSQKTNFIVGNPAGLKTCTVTWLISPQYLAQV
jgi:hypothetical protein